MLLGAYRPFFKWGVIFIGLFILIVIYKVYNPIESDYFPKCVFKYITGFECPGCGSQRSIHHLLNLEIEDAIRENPLLVFSLPYVFLGFLFDLNTSANEKYIKWRKILFGKKAIYTILIIIISFWIIRNT